MKLNRISLLLGLLITSSVGALASPAAARTMSGAGAVTMTNNFTPSCVEENFGAVYNSCTYMIPFMVFDLPIDNPGSKSVVVYNFGIGGTYGPIEPLACYLQNIDPQGGGYPGGEQTFNPDTQEALTFTINVTAGSSLRLVCQSVQSGTGIATLNWNP